MRFLDHEFEHGLRLSLTKVYEHMPDSAAIFMAFGPFCPGCTTRFVISAVGAEKLRLAMSELGQQALEAATAAAHSWALEQEYGIKAAVAMHWLLIDEPSFEVVIERILSKVAEEVPQHLHAPQDIEDLDIVTEVIKTSAG